MMLMANIIYHQRQISEYEATTEWSWWAKQKLLEKTCVHATYTTTNFKKTGLGLKLGPHGDRPATNSLRHDTAKILVDG